MEEDGPAPQRHGTGPQSAQRHRGMSPLDGACNVDAIRTPASSRKGALASEYLTDLAAHVLAALSAGSSGPSPTFVDSTASFIHTNHNHHIDLLMAKGGPS
jgi:hypothetical protein